jgi:hypothetical protein
MWFVAGLATKKIYPKMSKGIAKNPPKKCFFSVFVTILNFSYEQRCLMNH